MPKYIVSIVESDEETGAETPRYTQTVDEVDIHAVINAVNSTKPGGPARQRALRSDAGKPRARTLGELPSVSSAVNTE